MADLYPEIESYDSGLLDTGDGNLVIFDQSGHRTDANVSRELVRATDRFAARG